MKNIFQTVRRANVPKTAFDLSFEHKTTARFGYLCPVLVKEVLPGDSWRVQTESLVRTDPMLHPMMHRCNVSIHFFYVPNRIIFDDWEKLIAEGSNLFAVPKLNMVDHGVSSLADYLGLPVGSWTGKGLQVSALPFRAYYKIWNDYYRDQNLQTEIDVNQIKIGGTYATTAGVRVDKWPQMRAWEKDYFTSALPWLQKGDAGAMDAIFAYKNAALAFGATGSGEALEIGDASTSGRYEIATDATSPDPISIENLESVKIEVNELRRAVKLQRWLERNAQAGTRYFEHLLAHWGVKVNDDRLQRAEYIGGGKSPIIVSEVLNTTSIDGEEVLGSGAGHGLSVGNSNIASKYVPEHGYIMGIMSIMPKTGYMQGLEKHWTRFETLDFAFPEFAQLGEQEVLNKEIYLQGTADDDLPFGYQSRYAEYKYSPNTVSGNFRTTLKQWHLAREFADLPELNDEFITPELDDLQRTFAVSGEQDNFQIQLYHKITAVRPLPYHNNPDL